jgi:hypothetical protein
MATVTCYGARCDCCRLTLKATHLDPEQARHYAVRALGWRSNQHGELCARCSNPRHDTRRCGPRSDAP